MTPEEFDLEENNREEKPKIYPYKLQEYEPYTIIVIQKILKNACHVLLISNK